MLPKPCLHCQRRFSPRNWGMATTFCPQCVVACEKAVPLIERYYRANPQSLSADIAKAVGVPQVFVEQLFQQGRLMVELSRRAQLQAASPCTICSKALKPSEDVYCGECRQIIAQRMHHHR
jgi:hypothetical protein